MHYNENIGAYQYFKEEDGDDFNEKDDEVLGNVVMGRDIMHGGGLWIPAFGEVPPHDITWPDIKERIDHEREQVGLGPKPVSAATYGKRYSKFLKFTLNKGKFDETTCQIMERPWRPHEFELLQDLMHKSFPGGRSNDVRFVLEPRQGTDEVKAPNWKAIADEMKTRLLERDRILPKHCQNAYHNDYDKGKCLADRVWRPYEIYFLQDLIIALRDERSWKVSEISKRPDLNQYEMTTADWDAIAGEMSIKLNLPGRFDDIHCQNAWKVRILPEFGPGAN